MPAKLRIIAQAMKKSPLEAFHVILEFSNQEKGNKYQKRLFYKQFNRFEFFKRNKSEKMPLFH